MNLQNHSSNQRNGGYILMFVVAAVALMAITAVSLLALARSDLRSASSAEGRMRAKIVADAGLADAIALLKKHTRYGNYITATAPLADTAGLSESAGHLLPEIYRPTWFPGEDPTGKYLIPDDPNYPITGDYLFSLSNREFRSEDSSGETSGVLVESRPGPKDDVRGSMSVVLDNDGNGHGDELSVFFGEQVNSSETEVDVSSLLSSDKYKVTIPDTSSGDYYNFNQAIDVGGREGFLVQPRVRPGDDPPNALGQWVYTRDSEGRINGRFAFFIEDESMKANVDYSGVKERHDDIVDPSGDHQATEINPSAALDASIDKAGSLNALVDSGDPGERVPTVKSLNFLDGEWDDGFPTASPFLTTLSKSDLTTAKGWKRMDLNEVVANNAPAEAANIISNWIVDGWTGPLALGSLLDHQLYSNPRLRLQVAANIVDYIDADSIPTDCGEVGGYPVIGIEDIPYLVAFAPYLKVTDLDVANKEVTFEIRARLNFFNMYGREMDLADHIHRIEFTGLPAIYQTGGFLVMDEEDTIFTINVPEDLNFSAGHEMAEDTTIPQALDAEATGEYGFAGVLTFDTKPLKTVTVSYNSTTRIPTWQANMMVVEMYDDDDNRLDVMEMATNDKRALWRKDTSDLIDSGAEGHIGGIACLTESIIFANGTEYSVSFGDPRYRGTLLNDRWRNWSLAVEDFLNSRGRRSGFTVVSMVNFAYQDSRTYGIDWYRYYGDQPKLFHRNSPMLSVGELGNVSACEYPWRTLYLQYPERHAMTTFTAVQPEVELRRSSAVDYALIDLFKVGSRDSIEGLININSQKAVYSSVPGDRESLYAGNIEQGALVSLFEGESLYKTNESLREFPPQTDLNTFTTSPAMAREFAAVLSNRRRDVFASSDVNNSNFPWFKSGGALEYSSNPRPFYQVGEAAAPLGRALCFGPPSSSSDSFSNTRAGYGWNPTCTKVSYSVLGADEAGGNLSGVPQRTNQSNALVDEALERDPQVEAAFRSMSSATTTRGNVFRVLFVGQSGRDFNNDGEFSDREIDAEYLGEAFVERIPEYEIPSDATGSGEMRTVDSKYKVIRKRPVFE